VIELGIPCHGPASVSLDAGTHVRRQRHDLSRAVAAKMADAAADEPRFVLGMRVIYNNGSELQVGTVKKVFGSGSGSRVKVKTPKGQFEAKLDQVAYDLNKNDKVQYKAKDGTCVDSVVLVATKTIWPPSYMIKDLATGAERDTEVDRLIPRSLQKLILAARAQKASDETMLELLSIEEKETTKKKKKKKKKGKGAAADAEPTGPGEGIMRICKSCDMDVEEKYVESHLVGKKHLKNLGDKKGTPAADECWRYERRVAKAKDDGPDESRFIKVNGEVFDTALM